MDNNAEKLIVSMLDLQDRVLSLGMKLLEHRLTSLRMQGTVDRHGVIHHEGGHGNSFKSGGAIFERNCTQPNMSSNACDSSNF